MEHWEKISVIVGLVLASLSIVAVAHAQIAPPPVSVPEPGSLLLFGSGLAGLAGVAWRRSRRK